MNKEDVLAIEIPGVFLAELALFNTGSFWIQHRAPELLIRLGVPYYTTINVTTMDRQIWNYSVIRSVWKQGLSPGVEDYGGTIGARQLYLYCKRVYEWDGEPLRSYEP